MHTHCTSSAAFKISSAASGCPKAWFSPLVQTHNHPAMVKNHECTCWKKLVTLYLSCADPVSGNPSDHTKKSCTQSSPLPPFVQAETNAPVRLAVTAPKWPASPGGHSCRQEGTAPLTHHQCGVPTPKHWFLPGRDHTEAHQACWQASETAASWDWPGPEEWHVCSTPLFCLPLWAPQCHDGPKWPPQHKQMDN